MREILLIDHPAPVPEWATVGGLHFAFTSNNRHLLLLAKKHEVNKNSCNSTYLHLECTLSMWGNKFDSRPGWNNHHHYHHYHHYRHHHHLDKYKKEMLHSTHDEPMYTSPHYSPSPLCTQQKDDERWTSTTTDDDWYRACGAQRHLLSSSEPTPLFPVFCYV